MAPVNVRYLPGSHHIQFLVRLNSDNHSQRRKRLLKPQSRNQPE